VRIIQLTDLHITADPLFELRGIHTRATLERVLAEVQAHHAAADYLVVTGDLTHDEQLATYQALRELLAAWDGRLRVIPGNHDSRSPMTQVFSSIGMASPVPGRIAFLEHANNWTLIGLDTHLPGEVRGELGDSQLKWLERQLETFRDQPICVFLHHPPAKLNIRWLDEISLVDAEAFHSLVRHHDQVRLVCSGHVHMERTIRFASTTIFTSPSTGVQFCPDSQVLEIDRASPGFRVIDLDPGGGVSTWVERVPS